MYNGHQHIGKRVCLVGHGVQMVVEFLHLCRRFFLVTEDFDDLLTVHHLFDITFHNADGFLLRHKVFGALRAYFFGD